jgi:hypothetical protein
VEIVPLIFVSAAWEVPAQIISSRTEIAKQARVLRFFISRPPLHLRSGLSSYLLARPVRGSPGGDSNQWLHITGECNASKQTASHIRPSCSSVFALFQSELSRAELEQKILFPGFNLTFAWVRYQTWMNLLASGGVAFRALGTLFGETKLPNYAPAKWASQEKHDGSSANSRDSMEALQRTRQQRAAARLRKRHTTSRNAIGSATDFRIPKGLRSCLHAQPRTNTYVHPHNLQRPFSTHCFVLSNPSRHRPARRFSSWRA